MLKWIPVLFLMAVPAVAEDDVPRFEIEARLRALWIGGTTHFDEKPLEGDRVRLGGDLGFDSPLIAPSLRIGARVGRTGVECSFAWARGRGSATLDRDRTWNETVFRAGERVGTTLTWSTTRFGGTFRVVASETFDADLVLAARWDSFSLKLDDDGDNLGLVTPELRARAGLRWALGPAQVVFTAEIGVFGLPGKRAATLGEEISLGAGILFAEHVSVLIGYEYGRDRVRRSDAVQDNRMDLVFHGPSLRVEVRF